VVAALHLKFAYCNGMARKQSEPGMGKSGCPTNLTLEALGDRWSLIVIRDLMFGNRRTYGILLAQSEERIASNILASRLQRLTKSGFLTRASDPGHRQRRIYSLTEKAIQLVPLLAHMGAWGRIHTPSTPELSLRAQLFEEGGPPMWAEFMDDLRADHLGKKRTKHGPTVGERLQAAYEAAIRRS
jgi:DNA-binding HxlR family transcriptional regulator